MARPTSDHSLEDLLAAQRTLALKCIEDAKQCLAFNETLFKKIMQETGKSNGETTKSIVLNIKQPPRQATPNAMNQELKPQRQQSAPAPTGPRPHEGDLQQPLLRRKTEMSSSSDNKETGAPMTRKPSTGTTMFGGTASAPQTLRERVIQALKQKVYNVEDFYKEDGWAQQLARSSAFKNCTLFVIACNTIWMAIETDYNKAVVLCDAPLIFQIVDNFFTLYFMFEVCVRFCAFENKRDAFRDNWFTFDSVLVALMVWETYIFVAVYLLMGGGINSGGLKRLAIFRLFRLLRLTRVARMARLLRSVPELLVLSKAMLMALRSLGATLTLLMLVIYVFSIMFTQLLCDSEIGIGYFQTIPQTFNTLLMMGVFTEQREFFTHMLSGGFTYYLLMMAYILVGSYTVLNMLIGVICEVISDVANREREDIMIEDLRIKIGTISSLFAHGADDPEEDEPMICKKAFVELMNHQEATQALNEVGVDVVALVELADFIFPKTGKVALSKFMQLMLQFRGSNQATVKDIVDMRKYVLSELHELESRMHVRIFDGQICPHPETREAQ